MQSLHQWADGLLNNGKGKYLMDLLAAIPSIQKLIGLDVRFNITVTIDNIGNIEIYQLEELAKAMAIHIREIEKEKEQIESSNSSQHQSLVAALEIGIFQEVQAYHRTLKKSATALERQNNMMEALTQFMTASNQKFSDYLEKVSPTKIWRHTFKLLTKYQIHVIESFNYCILFAVQQIDDTFDRQVKKGHIILPYNSNRSARNRKSMPKQQESNKLDVTTFKKKEKRLKAEIVEKPVDKSVRLPNLYHQKKHSKGKPKDWVVDYFIYILMLIF